MRKPLQPLPDFERTRNFKVIFQFKNAKDHVRTIANITVEAFHKREAELLAMQILSPDMVRKIKTTQITQL